MIANFVRTRLPSLPVFWVRLFFNLYGPFAGAGIRVVALDRAYRYVRVELTRHWYNANYVGTHFGGAIYSMTDPFYMVMYLRNLGPGYIVWDKAAHIEFLKPGRRRLIAEFLLSDDDLEQVRRAAASGEKHLFDREVLVHDDEGTLIARVRKTLYVRKKEPAATP